MRIGIDLSCLPTDEARGLAGISNYAYLLAKHLLKLNAPHKFVFFLQKKSGCTQELQGRGAESILLPRKIFPFWTHHVTYARIIQKAKLDILHCPANSLPLFYKGRSVLTIHDLAIYKHPEWFPRGQWFSTKILVPKSIRSALRIIVPSDATKRDLIQLFHVSGYKVNVIPHGVEEKFFSHGTYSVKRETKDKAASFKFQVSRLYILFVGTIEPRKNLVRLVRAYAALPEDIINEYDLVIAGGRGWKYQEAFQAIRNLRPAIRSKVKMLGYVSDEELPSLMQNASVFVYPSLYEGFGLPVLEAMAAGIPVITSNTSSLPEVVGEAGLMVDPYSVEEIAKAIIKIIRDRARLSQISLAERVKAQQFAWENAAKRTLAVYLA